MILDLSVRFAGSLLVSLDPLLLYFSVAVVVSASVLIEAVGDGSVRRELLVR